MANSDNKINIGDTWKGIDSIQINIGDTWKDCTEAYINIGDVWKQLWTAAAASSDRGIFGGGYTGSIINVIDYIDISTAANATDFGDLTSVITEPAGSSNGTNGRGIFSGGATTSWVVSNVIGYITISTAGNATDFGDLTQARRGLGATDNGTDGRGVTFNGLTTTAVNTIDYITISTAGNATDFGDATNSIWITSATSNSTNERGVKQGGSDTPGYAVNVIDYITINSTGNATDFGDLTQARHGTASTSNGTNARGICACGYNNVAGEYYNIIDYINIGSAGNATDFGDLYKGGSSMAGTSNETSERGIFAGGYHSTGTFLNIIQYITINSTGNSTDFGDLTVSRNSLGGCSNA
jgi:hypothetical protein